LSNWCAMNMAITIMSIAPTIMPPPKSNQFMVCTLSQPLLVNKAIVWATDLYGHMRAIFVRLCNAHVPGQWVDVATATNAFGHQRQIRCGHACGIWVLASAWREYASRWFAYASHCVPLQFGRKWVACFCNHVPICADTIYNVPSAHWVCAVS
jgi:hypothetical protein